MTLYELTADYLQVLQMAEDPDVDPEVIEDTLEDIGGSIEDMADSYATVMISIDGNIKMLAEEIARLTERKKAMEANRQRIKDYLQKSMVVTGKTKFKTEKFSFSVQKNPASVVLDTDDIDRIPVKYLVPQEPKVNKTQIKEDLKAGMELPGIAHLEQSESLRIR